MDNPQQPPLFEELLHRARPTPHNGPTNTSTQQVRDYGLRRYYDFCERSQLTEPFPLTEDTAASFVLDMAEDPRDYSPNTVRTYLQAACNKHSELGHAPFNRYFAGRVQRAYYDHKTAEGWRPARKTPLLQEDLVRVLATLRPRNRARDLRDGCAMTLAWAIFGQCNDLHWLNLDEVQINPAGNALRVLISHRRTANGATGQAIDVPAHPDTRIDPVQWTVKWVRWLDESNGIRVGPLLRPMTRGNGGLKYPGEGWVEDAQIPGGRWSKQTYRTMIKNRCAEAGIPPENVAGYSLRSGGALGAYMAGAREIEINRHGAWSDGSISIYHHIHRVDAGRVNPLQAIHDDWEARMRTLRTGTPQDAA